MYDKGDKVHYHPIIGRSHDGKIYTVEGTGIISGDVVYFLKEKSGCVSAEAVSTAKEN